MDYKIEKKAAFTVLANAGQFSYENAKAQVPQFWQAHFAAGKGAVVMGTYGINIDAEMGNETFEYLRCRLPCKTSTPCAYTPAPGTAPARRPCRHRYTAFPPCQAFGSDCCRPLP